MPKPDFDKTETQRAKKSGKALSKSIQFWFRRRYNLPPNDPRFLALTPEEVEAEFWACQYAETSSVEDYEDDDIDIEEILAEADRADAIAAGEWEEGISDV